MTHQHVGCMRIAVDLQRNTNASQLTDTARSMQHTCYVHPELLASAAVILAVNIGSPKLQSCKDAAH